MDSSLRHSSIGLHWAPHRCLGRPIFSCPRKHHLMIVELTSHNLLQKLSLPAHRTRSLRALHTRAYIVNRACSKQMNGRSFFHHRSAYVSVSQTDKHVDLDLNTGRLERLHLDRSVIAHAVDPARATSNIAAARVTPHDWCRVSPFGNPGITAWLTAPPGLSRPPTSFIGS